jgi:predicted nuclease of predicted toxin-antitoxin system
MRLLLDQGLPRSAVKHLRAAAVDAEHVGDLGMHAATDAEILQEAMKRDAVVVTLDADFHHLLAASHATSPSVVGVGIYGV